ncbi:MAG TPA: sodium:solute symporter family protein [Sedimentibacter sp.]|nr:sodium:solute symporter family protein [Sedimentibacter sp.]HNZ82294.1 sodium:solute symporter family protein [Sedimentibacter sp.]HOH69343.1 sodium:solute symporter family protein [Sedimentibacter sp.]
MSSQGIIIWIATFALCALYFFIAIKQKKEAELSFSNYAIGGGKIPFFLLFFTHFANIMGVGNFMGHAGSAYINGLPWLAFIVGEQGSKIIFAIFFAGLAGRMTYNTFPEMIDDLITRDKVTRALAGVLASSIMIAWVGGQGKAFGQLFATFTGVSPEPIIIIFTVMFVVYTTMGGMLSLIWMDFIQGLICVVFGAIFYIVAFSKIDFSMAVLGQQLAAVGKAELFTFAGTNTMSLLTKFVTGCIGILVAQLYWQPCYAAKNPLVARRSMFFGGGVAIVYTILTAMVGLIILTLNQGLDANSAMPWFMLNEVAPVVTVMIFILVFAAGMSSADSNLNAAAILITNDLVRPFRKKEMTDAELIKLTRTLTIVIGAAAAFGGIYASTIMSLFSKAYSMAGAGLVPLLVIGLLWKENSAAEHTMSKKNSRITPWGARTGIVAGSVLSQLPALGPNAVLIALTVSAVCIVVISLLTKNVKNDPRFVSEGNVNPLIKEY